MFYDFHTTSRDANPDIERDAIETLDRYYGDGWPLALALWFESRFDTKRAGQIAGFLQDSFNGWSTIEYRWERHGEELLDLKNTLIALNRLKKNPRWVDMPPLFHQAMTTQAQGKRNVVSILSELQGKEIPCLVLH